MSFLSHDVLVEHETVPLSPFATFRGPSNARDFPKSAIRALHALELLASSRRPLRAIEIARALSLRPSSANQLLKAMVDWAYLIFDPTTKLYCASPRVSTLSKSSNGEYFGVGALDRLLEAAHRLFGQPVSLSAWQGSFMQVIDFYWPDEKDFLFLPDHQPEHPSPLSPNIGMHTPVFGSCAGAAWLLSQSEERIRAAIRLCRRDLGHLAEDVDSILGRVAQLREQGYAFGGIVTDEVHVGLSVPLPATPYGVVLVMSLFGHRRDMEERRDAIASRARDLVARLAG